MRFFLLFLPLSLCAITTTLEFEDEREAASRAEITNEIASATNSLSQSAAAAHQSLASEIASATNSLSQSAAVAHQSLAAQIVASTNGLISAESDPHALLRDAYSITTAGLITDWLIDNNLYGGVRVRYSSRNLDNYTAYAYNGIAVRRDNATQDYLFDAAHSNGIVRRAELGGYLPAVKHRYADAYDIYKGVIFNESPMFHTAAYFDYGFYFGGAESAHFGTDGIIIFGSQLAWPSASGTLALTSDISSATNATHQSLAASLASATNATHQSLASDLASATNATHQSLAASLASATNATHQSLASDIAAATNSLAAAETAAHQSLASGFASSLASATNATLAAANAAANAYTDAAVAALPAPPAYAATNTTAVLAYNYGKETVAIPDGATLSADLSNWRDGEQCFVVLAPQGSYTPDASVAYNGYGLWPTNTALCVAWRYGATVYVNPVKIME